MNRFLRTSAAATVLALSMSFGLGASQGVAYADRPPPVDPALLPSGDPARPPDKTEQKANAPCVSTQQGGEGPATPLPQLALNLDTAHQFSQGAGQLVAVIDTGVARHPRLPDLDAGGDYVAEGGDGTSDCDAHGTVVAGIIGAKPVMGQGFSGVAPDARILSIRQNSGRFQNSARTGEQRPEDPPDGYGPVGTLASAVRRAADRGATVINISLVLCAESSHNLDDGQLGAALRYATLEHNAVVVVAAGNKEKACNAGNPDVDPLNPRGDLWKHLNTNITPARFDDYVLTVGSIDKNGQPSKFTVPGPWVGVAAPGEDIVSLDARGTGTINGFVNDQQGITPLQGTSFAAPYVAGVVALVRARFPELSALEVIKRIEATAHAPAEGWNPYVGYGAIDPVAALTNEVPPTLPPKQATSPTSTQLAVPAPTPPPDNRARNIALIGSGTVAILLILGMLASFPIRRRFGISGDDM